MRVAFFGTYNRGHSANRIAAAAVKAAGYEILEIHDPLWERTRDKHAGYFSPLSLARLGLAWLGSAWRLARTWRTTGGAPVAVVGFNGQLDVLLLRLLAPRFGPRIVFAPLVSVSETLVDDRAVYAQGSVAARLLATLDRATCRAADVVVVDTEEHRRYFAGELGVDPSRLLVCHLGADPHTFLEPVAAPAEAASEAPLDVLWFGQYLPLHGLDVIVDAVGRLAVRDGVGERLRFTFVGTGEERGRIERNLRATRADIHFEDWIAYEELAARIAAADIVLGIFGSSRKARMVIPNKVYEAAAVGRAIVTADTPAVREVFVDGEELLLCQADGLALATAIARLADPKAGPSLRASLGAGARRRMLDAFSAAALGRSWSVALAGPEALRLRIPDEPSPRVGVVVLCFQDARRTLDCLHSLTGDGYPNLDVLVVDNASTDEERRALADGIEGKVDVEVLWLERNLGYAGANNVAMGQLFARGCEHVLLLNSDTLIAAGSIAAMVRAARTGRNAGPLGPRVTDTRPGSAPVSLGERYRAAVLWAPRFLLRVRARRQHPYPVSGVIGCAMMVPRALFERVGGFDESLFAYYEEVDLCLRARDAGFSPTVVPGAEVGHAGARGFSAGMTPLAAWLKARNLHVVGMRRVGPLSRVVFLLGYHTMVLTSATLYALRGRRDVAIAMLRGMRAGVRGHGGPPPGELFASSGYAASGFFGDGARAGDDSGGDSGADDDTRDAGDAGLDAGGDANDYEAGDAGDSGRDVGSPGGDVHPGEPER
ncbi:MAG: glycosyltransferase [Candidatus Binatia bacterium]